MEQPKLPSKPEEKPSGMKRFTTAYDTGEDRLRLSYELEDGTTGLLWITRRLAVRTVPELLKILDRIGRTKAAQNIGAPSAENMHRSSQMSALGQIKPQSPVVAEDVSSGTLMTGVGIRLTRKAVLVSFRRGDAIMLTVPFTEPLLRQWLGLLHYNFSAAQWQDDIWPSWISLKGGAGTADAVRLN